MSANIQENIEPRAPSNVLLGEIFGNILYLPIDLPTKYPPISDAIIKDKRNKGCFKLMELGILQIIIIKRYSENKI